ncbi:Uma2 family endonuclease [Frankia sp. AgPm24]|uniref:Uma2 family endonuclease n=1 Tax=Frankia umida TaxID=573489 RepID=A0ABT0JWH0_9ACTN|nr:MULTISPECIES: Uma2 family endonuclease [Frankia]MCK9875547.1 Uma2 family endonuclease [Frankia umida]MCK9922278.1 Uma2 family endonuclease [Frankia sp. AgPm24]
MLPPVWMHQQITAEFYDTLSEAQTRDIEIVDGMVLMVPSASLRHNRLAKKVAVALEAAGAPEWFADLDFDVRLGEVPLTVRRPDIVVYRASAVRDAPMRPENILLVGEVVSPGSETTDRLVKPEQYAAAGIAWYWRIEPSTAGGVPIVHTYLLDPAARVYRAGDVHAGVIDVLAPFRLRVDLTLA